MVESNACAYNKSDPTICMSSIISYFFSLGYRQVFWHFVFWVHMLLQRYPMVDIMIFLVLHVGTSIIILNCSQA